MNLKQRIEFLSKLYSITDLLTSLNRDQILNIGKQLGFQSINPYKSLKYYTNVSLSLEVYSASYLNCCRLVFKIDIDMDPIRGFNYIVDIYDLLNSSKDVHDIVKDIRETLTTYDFPKEESQLMLEDIKSYIETVLGS